MGFWDALVAEVSEDKTLWLGGSIAVAAGLLRLAAKGEHARLRGLISFFGLHLIFLPVAAWLRSAGSDAYRDVRLPCLIFAAVAAAGCGGVLVFSIVLPRLRLNTPRILQDVVIAAASIGAIFSIASRMGFNLSGLIATSAVVTAVIGISLQDSLANVVGGLALQLDSSFAVGDWIKVNDVSGRVTEIRWRYTAVETRNWETAIIPNALVMKNQVLVLGRRGGAPQQWRRWVWFNVDYRHPPAEVIAAVQTALRSAKIERVASDPPPNCVMMELGDSFGRYAARYWLNDLAADDATDSAVRDHVVAALRRAGIALSMPAQAVFVTEESTDRKARKRREHVELRKAALRRVDLFAALSDDDLATLAEGLRDAPFVEREVITRQGAEAHWLYLLVRGEVSVHISGDGGLEHQVARIRAPGFFGEMGLMTGEPRTATVVAETEVECLRLDKAVFQQLIDRAPAIAEQIATVLARRRVELTAAREGLDAEARTRLLAADTNDLLSKIRAFFGIHSTS